MGALIYSLAGTWAWRRIQKAALAGRIRVNKHGPIVTRADDPERFQRVYRRDRIQAILSLSVAAAFAMVALVLYLGHRWIRN